MDPIPFTVGAFLLSIFVNLFVIRRAQQSQYFIDAHDSEKPQRFHEKPTPRAGGIGVFAGLFPLLLLPGGWKMLLPAFLALFSGIMEDFRQSLSPAKRLSLQLIAALSTITLTGTVVSYLGFGIILSEGLALLFSAFAIVGAMNAFNIIDGFNGLAAGTALLILLSFGTTAYLVGDGEVFILILIVSASLLAFFLLNFPRGYIFLGDGGAYLLGFLLAVVGILLAARHETVSPWYILAVLIYPVWEVIFSIVRKLSKSRSPLQPDSNHLHMLIYRKITQNNPATSLLILGAELPFLLSATLFHHNSKFNFCLIILFIILYTAFYRRLRKKDSLDGSV